jgi:Leucine-rich repeat (LRR) protein
MQHIVARNGNNPLGLHLSGNNLTDDAHALSDFLYHCTQPPVGTYLTKLDLGNNQLKTIPENLKHLNNLKRLDLSNNLLKREDLQQLATYVNESLKELKIIDVSNNPSLTIGDVYNTIVNCETLEYIYAQAADMILYTYCRTGKKLHIILKQPSEDA